jgi:hypothetical protein
VGCGGMVRVGLQVTVFLVGSERSVMGPYQLDYRVLYSPFKSLVVPYIPPCFTLKLSTWR